MMECIAKYKANLLSQRLKIFRKNFSSYYKGPFENKNVSRLFLWILRRRAGQFEKHNQNEYALIRMRLLVTRFCNTK